MKKEKSFEFSLEGFAQCKSYNSKREFIENHPELLPVVLLAAVGVTALIISPMASTVAYKTSLYDSSIIAFKYLNGGF